jgi:hypothetical protein
MSRRRSTAALAAVLLATSVVTSACVAEPSPSPSPAPATPTATVGPTPTAMSPTASPFEPTPTPTPEPELSLPLPEEVDPRRVSVSTAIDLPSDGDGVIVVTVASGADSLIDELVLRWPIELHETLFPAPFIPSGDRIRDGGEPLVQPWTKWVLGPGERGEPEGTVSLGYGPLLAGATLEIPLYVTRNAPGPVSFDLQVLAGEAILTLGNGEPAELRLEVP